MAKCSDAILRTIQFICDFSSQNIGIARTSKIEWLCYKSKMKLLLNLNLFVFKKELFFVLLEEFFQ